MNISDRKLAYISKVLIEGQHTLLVCSVDAHLYLNPQNPKMLESAMSCHVVWDAERFCLRGSMPGWQPAQGQGRALKGTSPLGTALQQIGRKFGRPFMPSTPCMRSASACQNPPPPPPPLPPSSLAPRCQLCVASIWWCLSCLCGCPKHEMAQEVAHEMSAFWIVFIQEKSQPCC